MDLSAVEIPSFGARARAAEYLRAAKATRNEREARELEEIARAYRFAAKEGVKLIALTRTIAAGGTMRRTVVFSRGQRYERRVTNLLPRLAVCRAEAAFCYSLGVQSNGSVEFIDSLERDLRYRKGRVTVDAEFEREEGVEDGDTAGRWTHAAWTAMVPLVPPKLRPARGIANLHVLWEVDEWVWSSVPAPPGDPALLRHLGGDLYAVEAVWDLTEIEKLVLSGRRRES
jgi:hypothetical protein